MTWINWLSWTALGLGFLSALLISGDIASGHRQKMKVMEWVWPITCLYAGPIGLWMYWKLGRKSTQSDTRSEPAQRAA